MPTNRARSGTPGGAEAVVIGGGMVGAALTYRLAQAGVRVTLVDAGVPGGGTSRSSFAWINSADKPPRVYHDLNCAGMDSYVALGREFGAPPWLHLEGALRWATTAAGQALWRRQAERLRSWGYPIEAVAPERATRELEPGLVLDPGTVPEVWYAPTEGWVDAPAAVRALLQRAQERGATVRDHNAAVAIDRTGGHVAGVGLADGTRLAADVVVNCAGPWAASVAALAGVHLPVQRVVGLLAVTNPLAPRARHVCHIPDGAFRPDPSGGLVIGHAGSLDQTVEADTPTSPPPPACAELLGRVAPFRPDVARAGLAGARIGVRPCPRTACRSSGRCPR
jgi:glycine/D-amino acid oxidase-like deaminating enzyme